MSGRLAAVAIAALVVGALVLGARGDGTASDADRVERLAGQLRCPVCDGLAVADSPSSTARAIAADIRARVAAGETDADVRAAYVAQYGEWILLEPPGGGVGVLAWALPVALFAGGGGAATWVIGRRRVARAPSAADRAAVARALREGSR